MKGDKSILIALGKGKEGSYEEPADDESVESSEEELAIEDLFSAMKSRDAAAGAEALKAFLAACGVYAPEGADEDDGE